MKAAILTLLLITPLTLAIIYRPPPRKPPFDRRLNQQRVMELYNITRRVDGRETQPIKQPSGFPYDPDSATYEDNQ